jgi:hypothetical protein
MFVHPSNYEAILAEDVVGHVQIIYLYQIIRPNLAQHCDFLGNQLLIYTQTTEDVFYFPKGIGIERRKGKACANSTSLVGAPNAG